MNHRQLTYFLKIAELGSYRRVAAVLHIAQPALTRQVKCLEEDLGVKLFHRVGRGVSLTEAGELLRERAGFILRQFEQTRQDVIARGTVPRGEVNFGAPTSIGELLYPRIVTKYLDHYPDVKVRLFEGIGHLWDWLSNGEIDLAILPNGESCYSSNFVLKTLAEERVYLVGPSQDPTMPTGEASFDDIAPRPLIISGHPNTSRRFLERQAAQRGTDIRISVETANLAVQFQLVENGMGYALLPFSAVHRVMKSKSLSLCPVEGLTLYRTLARHADRPVTPAVAKMMEFIIAEAETLQSEGYFGSPVGHRKRAKTLEQAS